jgi:hypothetical protein
VTALFLLSPLPALAQAAVPIGFWTTPDNGERLLIQQDTSCSFYAVGGTQLAGNCVWTSSSNGGILAMYYQTANGLAPVYFNVVWANQDLIYVNRDPFIRRQ